MIWLHIAWDLRWVIITMATAYNRGLKDKMVEISNLLKTVIGL